MAIVCYVLRFRGLASSTAPHVRVLRCKMNTVVRGLWTVLCGAQAGGSVSVGVTLGCDLSHITYRRDRKKRRPRPRSAQRGTECTGVESASSLPGFHACERMVRFLLVNTLANLRYAALIAAPPAT